MRAFRLCGICRCGTIERECNDEMALDLYRSGELELSDGKQEKCLPIYLEAQRTCEMVGPTFLAMTFDNVTTRVPK